MNFGQATKRPTRTGVYILLAIVLAATPVSTCWAQSSVTQNVLIFFIDDLRPELGCYGVDAIKSPSIDALAAEGVLFERAYCQQALCAPSRISMMTGQYPDNTGICDLFTPLRRVSKETMTLPRFFRQNGYVTASFGKVYHHFRDDKDSWLEIPLPPSEKYADSETLQAIKQRVEKAKRRKVDGNQMRLAGIGPATESFVIDDEGYRDGKVAKQAIESLRKYKDESFFICVGFAKPHLPFAAPKRYWDLYRRDQFVVPERKRPAESPDLAFTQWKELRAYRGIPDEGDLSDELTRKLMHGYAASVSFADAQVGRVMAELTRLGLRENTLVVLWGDHGYKLGDYGMWCKHTNLELDTHVPLIVAAPGCAKEKRTKALVEIVDIFPTVTSMAGCGTPDSCDGESLEPVLQDSSRSFREFAFSQYQRGSTMGYSMRSDRWRYTEWIQTGTKKVVARELYDHSVSKTPGANLANNQEQSALVSRLSTQLNAAHRIAKTKVPMKRKRK